MDQLPQKQKYSILIAVMVPLIFVSLNQTIIGTTLPRIVEDIGGIEYFNWVFTIFMVTSSVAALLAGKMSDTYGRKPFLLVGVTIFTIASILCGLADNMIQLILYRGFQGFGGGIIITMAITTVGDLFVPRERGRWQALFSAQYALASVFGPTLGGYIVEFFAWPWVFWFFSPFGLLSLFMIYRLVPSVELQKTERIDFLGSIMFALAIVPLMLGFSWAGTKYEWMSVPVFALFGFSLIALLLFLKTEQKAQHPVLPLFLFKSSIFSISNSVNLLSSAAMFGVVIYAPFFIQSVMGESAMVSGFLLIPMMMSLLITSVLFGHLMSRYGRYKLYALIGILLNILGLYLASTWQAESSFVEISVSLILFGAGTGICGTIFGITVQNAVEYKYLGVSTASIQLSRQVGGVLGVAIMGAVLNARLSDQAEQVISDVGSSPMDELTVGHPETLALLAQGLSSTFLVGALLMGVAFILTIFLKEIPLRLTR